MPSDDLILNVRQIAGYPGVYPVLPGDTILMQRGGLGGAYVSASAADLVSTALMSGGNFNMAITGGLQVGSVQTGGLNASNAAVNLLSVAEQATIRSLDAQWGTIAGVPIATTEFASSLVAGLQASTVWSFNGRRGDVRLWIQDILAAGGAPIWSPFLQGTPMAPTPGPWSNSERLATTAFVQRAIPMALDCFLVEHPFVFTFNGRTGDVVLTAQDIIDAGGSGEIFDSPAFTGVPTAPTAAPGTNTNQVATTAFVQTALTGLPYAPINSPSFTGYPSGPTAPPGSSTGQLATTAFVMNAVAESTAGVASFNGRTGIVVLEATDVTGVGGALLASPGFTGVPTAPTAAPGSNSTALATTAFVTAAVAAIGGGVTSFNTRTGAITLSSADVTAAGGALLASPAFSGVPTAPTAAFGNSSQQIATTAFVDAAILNGAVESFNGRTGSVTLTSADISAAGGAALQSPAFLGTPTAPTAAPGSNSTQLATTAFVMAAVGVGAGVTSFNTRTGAVTLTIGDVTGVGGAPLNSPALTGTPTAPTASVGTSSTQLATTAFVAAALAGGVGVSSFNTRTGAVTLLGSDITAAGGAVLSSPAFTGTPTAPTQTSGNSSTALATTAFVQSAIAAGSVASFNGRVGAVTLIAADISAAGGALTASPGLTGVPTAPTATAGTNTNQIATTQFVETALAAAGGVNSFNGRAGAVTLSNADVIAVLPASTTTPLMNGTAAVGTNIGWSRGDHVHPTDTSRAAASALANYLPLSGGTITGDLNVSGRQSLFPTAIPAGAVAGSLIAGWITGLGITANGYFNGTNWIYNTAGGGANYSVNASGIHTWLAAPSGAAGATMTLGSQMQLSGFGSGANIILTIGSSVGGSGAVYFVGNGFGSAIFRAAGGLFYNESSGTNVTTNNWFNYFQSSSGTRFWQQYDGTNLMNLPAGGNLYIAGALAQGSDARGKRDILAAQDGMAEVRLMTPRRYHRVHPRPPAGRSGWDWPDTEELGFVAQEMEEALPVAVRVDGEGNQGVVLMPIIAALTNAIKELDARLAALEGAPA